MVNPDYYWNLAPFVGKEFTNASAKSFSPLGVDVVNKYVPGSVQFVDMGGMAVLERTMKQGEVGASGDFWFVQPLYDPAENTYTTQVFLRFEKDFFEKTRAGKLPASFHSESGVGVGASYPVDKQPPGFAMMVMFWVDRDVQGNLISAKNWDKREKNTAAVGDATYGYGIPRKNGKFANQELWTWDNGGGVRLTEESWWGITRVLKLNDIGQSNGYIKSYVANQKETEGQWALVGDRRNIEIRKDVPIYKGDFPIFQGGGSASPVPGGYGPLGDVKLHAVGFSTWKGEVVPTGQAFGSDGLPVLAFDEDISVSVGDDLTNDLVAEIAFLKGQLDYSKKLLADQGTSISHLTEQLISIQRKVEQVKELLS